MSPNEGGFNTSMTISAFIETAVSRVAIARLVPGSLPRSITSALPEKSFSLVPGTTLMMMSPVAVSELTLCTFTRYLSASAFVLNTNPRAARPSAFANALINFIFLFMWLVAVRERVCGQLDSELLPIFDGLSKCSPLSRQAANPLALWTRTILAGCDVLMDGLAGCQLMSPGYDFVF